MTMYIIFYKFYTQQVIFRNQWNLKMHFQKLLSVDFKNLIIAQFLLKPNPLVCLCKLTMSSMRTTFCRKNIVVHYSGVYQFQSVKNILISLKCTENILSVDRTVMNFFESLCKWMDNAIHFIFNAKNAIVISYNIYKFHSNLTIFTWVRTLTDKPNL